MQRTVLKTILIALPLTLVIPAFVAFAAPPAEDAGAEVEISDEEALDDDILMVIDLPIAADEARDAGLEEAEIDEAIDAAVEAAVSAAVITEALDDEAEHFRDKGKRKAFGLWVKLQIAQGAHGKELAALIHDRKEDLAAMSDEEKAELDAKIKELGPKHHAHRKALHKKRKQMHEEGKEFTFEGKERHDKMVAKADKRHAEAKAMWKQAKKAHKMAKHGDQMEKHGDQMEKHEGQMEKHEGQMEKREDMMEKREDMMEKREDKMEKREDKMEKREDKMDGDKPGKPSKQDGPGKKGPK